MYRKSYWKGHEPEVEYNYAPEIVQKQYRYNGYTCAHCGQWQQTPLRECPTCGSLMVKEEIDIRG